MTNPRGYWTRHEDAYVEPLRIARGNDGAAAELAWHLTASADILRRAAAENAAAFSRAEWNLLAQVGNGLALTVESGGGMTPGAALPLEISDAHALNGTGHEWLADEAGGGNGAGVDARVADLVERVRALPPARAWALATVIRWFWASTADPDNGPDHTVDDWWTLGYWQARDAHAETDA